MVKILSFDSSEVKDLKENPLKMLWDSFQSLDTFTKGFIIFTILLILATPFIITNLQIFKPHAATTDVVRVVNATGTTITETADANVYVQISLPQDWTTNTQPAEPTATITPTPIQSEPTEATLPEAPTATPTPIVHILQSITIENKDTDGSSGGTAKSEIPVNLFLTYFSKPSQWKLNDLKSDQTQATRTVQVTLFDGINHGEYITTISLVLPQATLTPIITPTVTLTPSPSPSLTPTPTANPKISCVRSTNPTNEIGGSVYKDMNNDKQYDQSPPQKTPYVDLPLSGWTVVLKDSSGQTITKTTSNISGIYRFINVCDGTYKITEEVQSGFTVVEPTGNEYALTMINAAGSSYVDFGNVQGQESITPTITTTVTPTRTPTPTPTRTPTPTPSPTQKPTPSPTRIPTPTVIKRTIATPIPTRIPDNVVFQEPAPTTDATSHVSFASPTPIEDPSANRSITNFLKFLASPFTFLFSLFSK